MPSDPADAVTPVAPVGSPGPTGGIPVDYASVAVGAISEGFVVQLANGEIVSCNPAAERILGLTRDQMAGRTSLDPRWRAVHEDGSPFPGETHPAMVTLRTGEALRGVVMGIHRPDGSLRWISVDSAPLPAAEGRTATVVTTFVDITERKLAEETLRRGEDEYRYLFEHAAVGIAVTRPSGEIRVNETLARILGYEQRELERARWQDVTHPDDVAETQRFIDSLLSGERAAVHYTKRYVRKDGSLFWAELWSSLRRDAAGAPLYLMTSVVDISERIRLEGEVWQNRAMLGAVIDSTTDAVYVKDPGGRYQVFNAAAERFVDKAAADVLGKDDTFLFLPDEAVAVMDADRRILEAGVTATIEEVVTSATGEIVTFLSTKGPLREDQGQVIGLFGIARDITERKRAEEALRRKDEILEQAESVAKLGSWILDLATGMVEISASHAAALGMKPGVHRLEKFFESLHPEEVTRIKAVAEMVIGGIPQDLEFRRVIDGEVRWFHSKSRVEFDLQGKPLRAIGMDQDITERVRLEEQLRQAQTMEAVGQLASGVAHDFNNAMLVVMGNAELLLADTPAEHPNRNRLKDIRAASERAARLTQQLLAFGRRQVLEPRSVDVHEALARVERMLRGLLGEGIQIRTDLAANPGRTRVDVRRFEQVIVDLALNARDAMPHGGRITIRTRNVETSGLAGSPPAEGTGRRSMIAISISDTGKGMTPEVKARLFEPFFTTKEFGRSSGLGLATSYGFVKQSGGDITVESEPGEGSTFTVLLPSESAPLSAANPGASGPALPRENETVLVVEDEEDVRRLVKISLESEGYRVTEARSGPEALEAVRAHGGEIRLVVTDVEMPGMGGRELADRLGKVLPGIPVLFVSGYSDDEGVRHEVEAGHEFLQKPFLPRDLARRVRDMLDAKGARIS